MAGLTATATKGKPFVEGTSSLYTTTDDSSDNFVSGAYSHNALEGSATSTDQWYSSILYLIQLAKSGAEGLAVYNTSGGTLNAGPVRVNGYNVANSAFTIAAADAAANTAGEFLLLASLANNTAGVAYIGGTWTSAIDTSASTVGNPVYLAAGGGVTLTAPTGADQAQQIIGRVQTLANPGLVSGLVRPPQKFGTSWLQALAVTAAKIASGAAASGTPLLADGAGAAAFSGTTRVQNGGTGAATLGTSKQLLLGNGTSAVTAMAAPTTTDASADAIVGTSATTKKALVIQGLAAQSVNVLEIQNSAGVTQFAISLGSPTVTGPNNTNLGVNAGSSLTGGSNNTNVGVNAGTNETSGSFNTFVGSLAAGTTQATGSNNTLVGEATDTNGAADSNATVIGQSSVGAGSSTIVGKGIVSSTANDLVVRSGDTGIARSAAGVLSITDGSGNVLTRFGRMNYQTKTANYAAVQADGFSCIDIDNSGSINLNVLTLPSAATVGPGWLLCISKADSSANVIPINPNASDAIEGAALPAALTISSVTRAATAVNVTTSASHGLAVGQIVTVTAGTNTSINGTWKVSTIVSATVFSYIDVTSGAIGPVADTGTVQPACAWLSQQGAKYTLMSTGVGGTGAKQGWKVIECSGDWVQSLFSAATWTATSTQWGDVSGSSIMLTPGEWDISINCEVTATASVTSWTAGIGTALGNSSTGIVAGDNQINPSLPTAAINISCSLGAWRAALTAPAPYYLKNNFTYTGAPTIYGRISARRIR